MASRETRLSQAILDVDVGAMQSLFRDGVELKPWHVTNALESKSVVVFETLIENGWDINELLPGWPALPAMASVLDDPELLTWFLNHGADPNSGEQYETVFSYAIRTCPMEAIEKLLRNGADVRSGQPLHHLVERQCGVAEMVGIADMLIRSGCPLHEVEFGGRHRVPDWRMWTPGTPLHKALLFQHFELARFLVANDASLKAQDTKGRTPVELMLLMIEKPPGPRCPNPTL